MPPIDFYQLKVEYETQMVEQQPDTTARLADPSLLKKADASLVYVQDFEGNTLDYEEMQKHEGESLTFQWWLQQIAKESMGTLTVASLCEHETQLRSIFEAVTLPDQQDDGSRIENTDYDHYQIRANIRKAFVPKRDYTIVEEVVPESASILSVEHPKSLDVLDDSRFYPSQEAMREILDWDANPDKGDIPQAVLDVVENMRKLGMSEEQVQLILQGQKVETDNYPERKQTYQYLPYRFDSNCCYRKVGKHWEYDGKYVPDFLVLSRDAEGHIDRIC